jgi:hypothetical protein
MTEQKRSSIQGFERQCSEAGKTFAEPGEERREKGGPLDEMPRRSVSFGAAIGSQQVR